MQSKTSCPIGGFLDPGRSYTKSILPVKRFRQNFMFFHSSTATPQKNTANRNFACNAAFFQLYDAIYKIWQQNNHPLDRDGTKGARFLKQIEVKVLDNDLEKAMRILKKKIQNDGLFKRLKLKKSYEKPSEYRRRKQRESLRRQRIAAAKARMRRY